MLRDEVEQLARWLDRRGFRGLPQDCVVRHLRGLPDCLRIVRGLLVTVMGSWHTSSALTIVYTIS
jgi:hypothetical protein